MCLLDIKRNPCSLVFEDGSVVHGYGFGAEAQVDGEIGKIIFLYTFLIEIMKKQLELCETTNRIIIIIICKLL